MPPKQATLGKFFGLPPGTKAPAKEQTKLALKSKSEVADSGKKEEGKEKSNGTAKLKQEVNKEDVATKVAVDGEGDNAMEDVPPSSPIDQDEIHGKNGIKRLSLKEEGKPLKMCEKVEASVSRKRKSPVRETPPLSSEEDEEPITKRGRKSKLQSKPEPKGRKEATVSASEDDLPTIKQEQKKTNASKTIPNKSNDHSKEKKNGKPAPAKKAKSPSPVISEKAAPKVEDEDSEATESGEDEPLISDSEEEKPAAKAAKVKVAKKVQQTLTSSSTQTTYDWKSGESPPYAALVKMFTEIDGTTKRLEITAHASLFLRQVLKLSPNELLTVIHLMINRLAADYSGIELGIGESLLMKAISESTGRTMDKIKAAHAKIGDLGVIAQESRQSQPTMFKPKALTCDAVFQGLYGIATTKGDGAQGRKVAGIKKLIAACQGEEPKFLVRGLEGKLRLGLAEKTVLTALAQAVVVWEKDKEGKTAKPEDLLQGEGILKQVFSNLPSYEVIIPAIIEHGMANLKDNCKLQPGVPLKPMLAKPTKSIGEVLDRFQDQKFTCEYKYDGERAQIHYVSTNSPEVYASTKLAPKKGLTAIFSRNSEDLSKKYPDILAVLHKWVQDDVTSFVLDCEAVAWDKELKKVLPFQQLMTRKKKDVIVEDVKVKVCVFAFDLLFLNGKPVVHDSLSDRRKAMTAAFKEVEGEFAFAKYSDTDQVEEIQTFLDESMKASCEGLMVKMLEGTESGYEPSKRSRNWLKIKKDYLSGIGDSLDLVVVGAYHGRGKRTSVFGAFMLACYNSSTETYETICNIGTGFSEEVLLALHKSLSPHIIAKPKPFYSHSNVPKDQPDVWFEPSVVWEVLCADLTLSPRYKAAAHNVDAGGKGVSLRFPRFVRERDDKKPGQATTARQVAEMYKSQDSVGGKGKDAKGVDDDWDY